MRVIDWGLIHYSEASARQLELVDEVVAARDRGAIVNEQISVDLKLDSDILVFCTHPEVVTTGRGTQPDDIFSWSGEVLETSRGGRATYHGPSQLVVYPIIDLSKKRSQLAANDLHGYLRILEGTVVNTLREFGVASEARTIKFDDGSPSLTGVWVGDKKIASIGIAVKKWVSYHGVAINMFEDATAFQGINPCGFKSDIMTSFAASAAKPVDVGSEFLEKFKVTFASALLKAISA